MFTAIRITPNNERLGICVNSHVTNFSGIASMKNAVIRHDPGLLNFRVLHS